jgi:hypothetical protein
MPVLNLLAYPRDQWHRRLWGVMLTPVGAESGALFDAMEADVRLRKETGRRGRSLPNHLLSQKRQIQSGPMWRGFTVGYVLMLTLAKAEAGEKRKGIRTAMSEVQSALEEGFGRKKDDSLSELRRSWRAFKPTAHLWGMQSMCWLGELRDDPPPFLKWIAGAEDLRRRGEAFRPLTAKSPILDPDTAWRMPDDLALPSVAVPWPSADTILSRIKSGVLK